MRDVRLDSEKRDYDVIGSIDHDSYYLHKYIQGSGIALDWFVRTFVQREGMSASEAMAQAEAEALKVRPGSGRMLAIGLLSGSAMPFDSELRGLFMGHGLNHERGHFYHALLESFSYDLALTLDSMCRQYPQLASQEIKLIGGGARSAVWPQMLADVTGHRFAVLDRQDVSLWGTAMLAAAATGGIGDIAAAARSHVSVDRVFEPDPGRHAFYRPYVALYEEASKALHGLFARLNAL